ncbi:MAG: lysoplasmalogenase [Alphaproteobacteria bacterium]|nr:lysoplasmalogenase [Alphaproteobacteria bacterium]
MKPSPATLAAWGVATATLWAVATWTGGDGLAVAAKPLPVLCMAAWALTAGDGRYGALVGAGLVMGALGDLLLALDGLFVPGLASFLVAHVLYAAAFTLDVRALRPTRALPFAVFGGLMLATLWGGLGEMAAPVSLYTAAICAMLWRAAARVQGRDWRRWAGLVGAASFALSDSMIAVNLFHTPLYETGEAVMATYWLGQLGVTLTVPREGQVPSPPPARSSSLRS